jgi:threonine efflux protein
MNVWTPLLSLVVIWSLVVISPGPCFVAVVQLATAGTRRDGISVAVGIAAGTVVWCALSLVELSVLFARFAGLYDMLRYAGAAYLIYLGIATMRRARAKLSLSSAAPQHSRAFKALQTGFLTDISNPKAAAFFSSLFAALLPPQAPLWLQASAVAIVMALEFGWYCLVSLLVSLPTVARAYARAKRWIDCVTGIVFVSLGARLAITR